MTLITFHLKSALGKHTDGARDDYQNGGYQNSLVHVAAHPNGHRLLDPSPSPTLSLFVRSHDHAHRRFVLMPCAVQMFTQRAADAHDEISSL